MNKKEMEKIQEYIGKNCIYEFEGDNRKGDLVVHIPINIKKQTEMWELFKKYILEGFNKKRKEK
jgi:hypothetical protein